MFKKILWGIALCYFLLFNFSVLASPAQDKVGPPYPEVWGYDLSTIPAIKWGLASINGYYMEDGDVWFLIDYSYKKRLSIEPSEEYFDEKYIVLKFFKGEQKQISEEECKDFFKTIEKQVKIPIHHYDDELIFRDGSKMKFHPDYNGGPRLFSPDFYNRYFSKIDLQGNEKRYSILTIAPQVNIQSDGGRGESKGAPFFYQRLYLMSDFMPLKDDTFIVFAKNLILRVDKDFKTKFKPITPVRIEENAIMHNFFIIDYSLIKQLASDIIETPFPYYQGIHDALLRHFHNQYSQ